MHVLLDEIKGEIVRKTKFRNQLWTKLKKFNTQDQSAIGTQV